MSDRAAMTGPEHYRAAERILARLTTTEPHSEAEIVHAVGLAQAHAQLAQVAVLADLASHAAPPAERTRYENVPGVGYHRTVDEPWKALFHPSPPPSDSDIPETVEPPF